MKNSWLNYQQLRSHDTCIKINYQLLKCNSQSSDIKLVTVTFPKKAPELFAYQAITVWAECNYDTSR